jgi:predicted ribosome quality control (RQC) complex YloA/Tae2 family protein
MESDKKTFSDPIEAINYFYNSYQKKSWLESEKRNLLKRFRTSIKKSGSYILNSNIKLEALTGDINYHQIGDIIMSNLSSIRMGSENITLFDFYNERDLEIKLKPTMNPQKNAENYYRKGKNQKQEIKIINRNISIRKKEVEILEKQVAELNDIDDFKALKEFIRDNSLDTSKTPKQLPPQFKVYRHLGFKILVGRNAKNNDELSFRHSYKEDLWLHAKDVTGSHVLIKYQSGKPFPKPVIEKAAQLAAYYSKNKNSNTCPVIITEKKFVRKSKRMPPGTVVVEKEKMLMVQPIDYQQEIES